MCVYLLECLLRDKDSSKRPLNNLSARQDDLQEVAQAELFRFGIYLFIYFFDSWLRPPAAALSCLSYTSPGLIYSSECLMLRLNAEMLNIRCFFFFTGCESDLCGGSTWGTTKSPWPMQVCPMSFRQLVSV